MQWATAIDLDKVLAELQAMKVKPSALLEEYVKDGCTPTPSCSPQRSFGAYCRTYCCVPDPDQPTNVDVHWRLAAIARGLALPMPRPYRAPYFPGITVLIPHYGEQILIHKEELYKNDATRIVSLMHWMKQKYEDDSIISPAGCVPERCLGLSRVTRWRCTRTSSGSTRPPGLP